MKRLDELTQLAIDGILSSSEEAELQSMLAGDPEARTRYHNLIEVEIALRGLDERLDVSEAVMARLATWVAVPLSVLPDPLPTMPRKAPGDIEGKVERWTLRLIIPVAAAAAITLAFALFHDRTDFEAPTLAAAEGVAVLREGKDTTDPKPSLRSGDRIVVGKNATGTLTYRDQTRIQLSEASEVRVDSDPARGGEQSKSLELLAGTLAAVVEAQPEDQPLIVKTPHAVAVVRGTQFELTAGSAHTRLEVTEGRVDFFTAGSTRPAVVTAGTFAVADSAAGAMIPSVRPMRRTDGLVAFYSFEEGAGGIVHDRSGHGEPLDLVLSGAGAEPLEWLPGGGVRFEKKGHLASRGPATKIYEASRVSGELTVEAWIEAAPSVGSGPARIVTFSRASERLNFMIGQGTSKGDPEKRFVVRLRSSGTVSDWQTPVGSASGELNHLVLTREKAGRESLWLDGAKVAEREAGGTLDAWLGDLSLAIGDDPGGENRKWRGVCHLVAIYDRVFTPAEVARHFEAGVGR